MFFCGKNDSVIVRSCCRTATVTHDKFGFIRKKAEKLLRTSVSRRKVGNEKQRLEMET
jgi:hypothetical protein